MMLSNNRGTEARARLRLEQVPELLNAVVQVGERKCGAAALATAKITSVDDWKELGAETGTQLRLQRGATSPPCTRDQAGNGD